MFRNYILIFKTDYTSQTWLMLQIDIVCLKMNHENMYDLFCINQVKFNTQLVFGLIGSCEFCSVYYWKWHIIKVSIFLPPSVSKLFVFETANLVFSLFWIPDLYCQWWLSGGNLTLVHWKKKWPNKKVLLRERRRHTARRVVTTPSVDLAGGERVPYLGTPPSRVPPCPPSWVPPSRVPPAGPGRVPPRCLPHGILGNVAKHYGIWVPPLWTDRLMEGQTRVKTLPSHRTTYAGGKNDCQ